MRILLGIILLFGAALLQVTLVTRLTLLQGVSDLVFLTLIAWMLQPGNKLDWRWGLLAGLLVGYASALPDWVLWLAYAGAAFICQILRQRLWQGQLLAVLSITLLGTLFIHLVTLLYLFMSAHPMDALEALNLITVPSMLLNLIFVLPVYAIISELNKLIIPSEQTA
jgi:cell shape-determining protein MreD